VDISLRALHSAVDVLNQAVADALGINRTDLRCIEILSRDGPQTAGNLASAAGLTTGAATTAIDRLERAGFARRSRDPVDRRRVVVELVPEADQRVFALYRDLLLTTMDHLERYSVDQLNVIRDFVEHGRQMTLDHAERIRQQTLEGASDDGAQDE
jgi:DNA-binding MarR family transcriptional regulator